MSRRQGRDGRLILVAALVAASTVAAGSGGARATGSASPASGGAATRSASPAPGWAATGAIDGQAVIQASLDAFAGLTSYRYEHRVVEDAGSGMEVVTLGTIIDGDPFRSRREMRAGGEVGWVDVQVGGDRWRSVHGSGFRVDEAGADPHPGPLDAWAAALLEAAEAGLTFGTPVADTLDGVEVLRYAGTTPPADPAASPDPWGARPTTAQVELVVEAATGRLMDATVAIQASSAWPPGSAPATHARLEHVRISGVDDPGNVVEAPIVGPAPTGAPSGDPALETVVLDALDALAAARSWRAVTESVVLGRRSSEQRTVVSEPVPAVEVWSSVDGRRGPGLRVIGRERWSALGDPLTWGPMPPGETCFGAACDIATLRDVGAPVRPVAGTFIELPAETLGGIPVRHLRSEAGMIGPDGPIPGSTDLWVEVASGVPVRIRFDGQAVARDTRITNVDDAALTVERPDA